MLYEVITEFGDTSTIMIPNNPAVGIDYKSGGIHLKKNSGLRGEKNTEAEICWTCHDARGISEWGTDTGGNNFTAVYRNNYNYGQIYTSYSAPNFSGATSNWLGSGSGAFWQSGTAEFQTAKAGRIQSTHSTSPSGTSAVTYDPANRRFNERNNFV